MEEARKNQSRTPTASCLAKKQRPAVPERKQTGRRTRAMACQNHRLFLILVLAFARSGPFPSVKIKRAEPEEQKKKLPGGARARGSRKSCRGPRTGCQLPAARWGFEARTLWRATLAWGFIVASQISRVQMVGGEGFVSGLTWSFSSTYFMSCSNKCVFFRALVQHWGCFQGNQMEPVLDITFWADVQRDSWQVCSSGFARNT